MSHGKRKSPATASLDNYVALAVSLGNDCDLSPRDISTVRSRIAREGLPFLTTQLPLLAKALCAGVTNGYFEVPLGFKTRTQGSALPAFLYELLFQVFEDDGTYRDDVNDVRAFKHIYQFCSFFYKMKQGYDDAQISTFADGFVATDSEVSTESYIGDPVINRAKEIFTEVLHGFQPEHIVCKDGPGAISNGTVLTKGTKRLDHYPITQSKYLPHFFISTSAMVDEYDRLPTGPILTPRSKVIFVEKDSRGPRVISAEPRENQFVQQGIRGFMYDAIERHPTTRGQVNFTDQSYNQRAALETSRSRLKATIDLKDASDRVSLSLVNTLLSGLPELRQYVMDSRSVEAGLPDGRVVNLRKFAPMGSALCFPVMALTIFALIKSAIDLRDSSLDSVYPPTVGSRELVDTSPDHFGQDQSVLVYGDDIIVHVDYAQLAIDTLVTYGLKVNSAKSYLGGPFAESCGCDAYRGVEVTPVRLRVSLDSLTGPMRFPNGKIRPRPATSESLSLIETINQLDGGGFASAAEWIFKATSNTIGDLPFGEFFSGSPCVNKGTILEEKFRTQVRRPRYWAVNPVQEINADESGWTHLLRTINSLGSNANIPRLGEYSLPKLYEIVPTRKPRWFDAEYPACDWLPPGAPRRNALDHWDDLVI